MKYYDWLVSLINGPERLSEKHKILLWKLYSTEYFWTLNMDSNRALDGIALRERYSEEFGALKLKEALDTDLIEPVTVLEMMIALAKRCEEEIMGDPLADNNTWYWFWVMIDNLGLGDYSDEYYDDSADEAIKHSLNLFMSNRYASDGSGGLFKVIFPKKDMRKTEIWYQMNWWLAENYTT